MTKKISVGYDGTQHSAEAVEWAAEEAASRDAVLRIVCCYSIPVAGAGGYGWPASNVFEVLLEVAEQNSVRISGVIAGAHRGLRVETTVSPGPADLTLTDGMEPDDLIVIGAGRYDGVAGFWLGSTARRLVRHSPCPVVVVRGAASRGRPDRVVVGIDGSSASDAALDWAGDEADRHQVELVVVHAWSYPYSPVNAGTSQAHDLLHVDAACVLDRAVEHARERVGVEVSGCLIEDGSTTALLNAVRDGDLVVLGSRGRGAIVAGLLGSTVNAVLDRAQTPVVVVRGTN